MLTRILEITTGAAFATLALLWRLGRSVRSRTLDFMELELHRAELRKGIWCHGIWPGVEVRLRPMSIRAVALHHEIAREALRNRGGYSAGVDLAADDALELSKRTALHCVMGLRGRVENLPGGSVEFTGEEPPALVRETVSLLLGEDTGDLRRLVRTLRDLDRLEPGIDRAAKGFRRGRPC